jgi:CelD/BcsL family acetyltransferase involved in cellulose biosynthesis
MFATGIRAPTGDQVEEIKDPAVLGDLRRPWEELLVRFAAGGGTAGPFLSPAWFQVYAASLAAAPRALRVLAVRRGGELMAVLPLVLEWRRLAGAPARVLRSLSDDHSQRFDAPILDDAAADALLAHLLGTGDWHVLELRDVLDAGARTGVARLEAAARRARFALARWPAMTSPYLAIPPAGRLDEVLPGKFRYNLRRRRKKLGELGAVAIERVSGDASALGPAIEDALRLEAAGWKGEGGAGTAVACDPALTARYTELARAFAADGRLALRFLTVGGKRVASHFAVEDDGIYYLFKPGYDPTLAKYGLGHLLVEDVVQDLAARGFRELDFLGDDMAWKRNWTSTTRAHSWRYLFRPSVAGHLLHAWKFQVVPRLKRHLPGRSA